MRIVVGRPRITVPLAMFLCAGVVFMILGGLFGSGDNWLAWPVAFVAACLCVFVISPAVAFVKPGLVRSGRIWSSPWLSTSEIESIQADKDDFRVVARLKDSTEVELLRINWAAATTKTVHRELDRACESLRRGL